MISTVSGADHQVYHFIRLCGHGVKKNVPLSCQIVCVQFCIVNRANLPKTKRLLSLTNTFDSLIVIASNHTDWANTTQKNAPIPSGRSQKECKWLLSCCFG